MAYEVILDKFTGPLDLLLHLIQTHEIDIHDIPIAVVTEQYLVYLSAMEELSLDIASEFVVMAATLLAIKSRLLLPRPPAPEDGEPELDPREQLVLQLLEYQRCKWAAAQLRGLEVEQSQVFSRAPMDLREYAPSDAPPVQGVTMWDLVDAFRKLRARAPKEPIIAEIRGHVVSVEERMALLLSRLKSWQRITFHEWILSTPSRAAIVSSFLALLELIKDGSVRCLQSVPFGDIEIELSGADA